MNTRMCVVNGGGLDTGTKSGNLTAELRRLDARTMSTIVEDVIFRCRLCVSVQGLVLILHA